MTISRLIFVFLIAALGLPAQPVGLGNGRDLVLRSSLDGGAETDAAKIASFNQTLTVSITSPGGTCVGAPLILVADLRPRVDWSVLDIPGDPLAFGIGTQMFTVLEGPPVSSGGFVYSASLPDWSVLGHLALWVQAAAIDPTAPNGLAITRSIRHDPWLLESEDHLTSTEFNAGTRLGNAMVAHDVLGGDDAELIVSLPGADPMGISEAGEVRVLAGGSLSVVATLVSPTPQAGAWFGSAIAAGDVTGDGVTDLIIGARHEDESGVNDAGAAYVFAGPNFTSATRLVSPAPEATARFGHEVAVADWNNDGIGDVVIGAPRESAAGFVQAGRVHVFPGPSFSGPVIIENPSPQSHAKFGYAIAVGDLDGTAGDDLVITTPFHDVAINDDTGRADVFFAPATVPGATITQPIDTFALLGSDVCVGDFDGDGYVDVAVGAEFDDQVVSGGGSVHVAHGPSFTAVTEIASPAPLADAGFGSALDVGDVNADGYPDLVVGEFWRDIGGHARAGKGWVLFGPSFAQSRGFEAPTLGQDDRVGRRVAVGDLDGDHYADPVFGAPYASPGGHTTEGEVHVVRQ